MPEKRLHISPPDPTALPPKGPWSLSGSKSESNRALIIRAISSAPVEITGVGTARDVLDMQRILGQSGRFPTIDCGPAGTTFRFLCAFLANRPGEWYLTGSERMKKRPIAPLVNNLRQLGATIEYADETGFPPLRISGRKLTGGLVRADASQSSQFVSALMLIAPTLQTDMDIQLESDPVSAPYLLLTQRMMEEAGADVTWQNNHIRIAATGYRPCSLTIEPDWSSLGYWYLLAALSPTTSLFFPGYRENSLQGDRRMAVIAREWGIESTFSPEGVCLIKQSNDTRRHWEYDFSDCPDLAQTAMAYAAGRKQTVHFTGLSTLKIKESDRLEAMKEELGKLGVQIETDSDSWHIVGYTEPRDQPVICTHHDHRIAMSLAPLALIYGPIQLEDPDVVKKSYPEYWSHLHHFGFTINFTSHGGK